MPFLFVHGPKCLIDQIKRIVVNELFFVISNSLYKLLADFGRRLSETVDHRLDCFECRLMVAEELVDLVVAGLH
jgi:hypothetical protein